MTHTRLTGTSAARIFLPVLATLYMLGFTNLFLRSSFGVLAPGLASEMRLSPVELSAVASSFFFAYALMQVPTGVLLDRFGPRRTLATMLAFALVGAAVFASASTGFGLALGRVAMGIGCAGVFTGAFYVLALWLPKERVVSSSGVLNSFASLGNLAATTPLALLIFFIGWRQSYWLFAAGVALLLVSVALLVRDRPPGSDLPSPKGDGLVTVIAGLGSVVRQPGLWRLLVLGFPISASSTLAGAWGAPYLRDVHGLDDIARGNVLLAMALFAVCGHTFLGYASRFTNSSKMAIIAGGGGVVGGLAGLALAGQPPLWLVVAFFCLIGLAGSYPTIALAHARGLVPVDLMGRGVSVTNMGVMLAVASMQFVFGLVVGVYPSVDGMLPEQAYRTAFGVHAVVAALAMAIYCPIPDVRPRS